MSCIYVVPAQCARDTGITVHGRGLKNYTHTTSGNKTRVKYRNVCSFFTDWVARLTYINNKKILRIILFMKNYFWGFYYSSSCRNSRLNIHRILYCSYERYDESYKLLFLSSTRCKPPVLSLCGVWSGERETSGSDRGLRGHSASRD
jgi:hypothetical protein